MAGTNKHLPMSIDAMLDMERQEVLALLENKQSSTARAASPYAASSRSPVRSMLDIDEEPSTSKRHASPPAVQRPVRSMLDIDGAPEPAPLSNLRSMLDVGGPSNARSSSQGRKSQPASPTLSNSMLYKGPSASASQLHPRSKSDAAYRPVDFGPRRSQGPDVVSGYQFSGILPHSSSSQNVNKRPQPVKRSSATSSLAEALRSGDFSNLQLPGDRGRKSSYGSRLGNQSKSPSGRWNSRSRSPATFGAQQLGLGPNKAMLDDGQVVDISSAYRRLSDANLAFSSGSLSQLPSRKKVEEGGSARLVKDYLGPDGEHLESSDEEDAFSSDDEDRGRKKAPRTLNPDATGDKGEAAGSNTTTRQTLSLLAAADEERKILPDLRLRVTLLTSTIGSKIAQQQSYQYRSLLEPEIKITNSSGDLLKPTRSGIHPNTSYDQYTLSANPSLIDSDEEADMDDIMRAQKLSFTMTNILDNPEAHRSIRIIYRGEYHKIAQAAEEEHQRPRKYLVATDLSDESTHALEWAIGTVLRDGDTLIAIYCVDEETGIVTDNNHVPDDPKAMREQAAAINTVANSKTTPAPISPVTDFQRKHLRAGSGGTPGTSPSPSMRGDGNKAAAERHHAIQDMTTRVLRLLRKTKLQVRVIVEVLHCKNPRHLITEVIDLISPTLVVIGSRGRSALKGYVSFASYYS